MNGDKSNNDLLNRVLQESSVAFDIVIDEQLERDNVKILLVDFFVDGHHVEYAAHLARYLLEQGHEVTLATWQPDDRLKSLSDIGVRLCYIAERQSAVASDTLRMIPQFTRGLRNCLQIATREGANIIHLLALDRAILLPLWWNVVWSDFCIPIFGTLHAPYHFIDHPHLSPLKKLYHRMVQKALKSLLVRGKLGFLFVHTERIKEVVLRALQTGCAENRVGVVPIPLPDLFFLPDQDPSKQACRARLGLPPDPIVLLFFGQLRESKGPDVLLKAVNSLPPEVFVLFAGFPQELSAEDWDNEVRSLGLNGRVRLDLGYVPYHLVSVYFQAADAVVLPYRRGFLAASGVLQWAAAAHKPVIATDVGEAGHLVKQHGLGLVVEPEDPQRLADAIRQYVKEREAIDTRVMERAALYSSQNHWRQTAAATLAAYQGAVSR